jgi:hypothetical protein
MIAKDAKLLCVGKELDLPDICCAVLNRSGFDARSGGLREAEVLLSSEQVRPRHRLSYINAGERGRIISAVGESRTLVLQGVTFPTELLAEVEQRLA